jgi:hypothetical protein
VWKDLCDREKSKGAGKKEDTKKPQASNGGKSAAKQRDEGGISIPEGLVIETGIPFRNQMRRKFIEILQTPIQPGVTYDAEDNARLAKIGVDIETELDKVYGDVKGYSDKARSLMFNLRDPKNP